MISYKDIDPIENIGPRESRKRIFFGIAVLILTIFVMIIEINIGLNRFWRLPLFFPFMMASLGFFQAREKT